MSTSNAGTSSSRGTDWRFIIASSAFRAGFEDARLRAPFRRQYETNASSWRWWYEHGRLFAASPCSRRWQKIPTKYREVSSALVHAACKATRRMDIPPSGIDWS